MPPHTPAPLPRKVEVDLSGILIRPERIQPPGFGYEAQLPVAVAAENTDWSIGRYLPRLGPPGFANMIFAVGSCVLGLFCTLSVVDNLEHFRRIAHLPGDPIYRRPESSATASQRFTSKTPSRSISKQSGESNEGLPLAESASSDQTPPVSPSTLPLMGQNRYFPLLANNDRLFDNLPNNSNSSGSAHEGGGGGSGGSGGGNGNGNGKHQTTSEQSPLENLSRRAPKSIVSSRTKSSSGGRQGLGTWLSGGLGVAESDKSAPQITRSAGGSIKSGGHNLHLPSATTQSVSARNTMSMHSAVGNVAAMQSHATVNHMQMQSGMLAQPAFARGLGGLNGGGLGGGGGGGRHGANARR